MRYIAAGTAPATTSRPPRIQGNKSVCASCSMGGILIVDAAGGRNCRHGWRPLLCVLDILPTLRGGDSLSRRSMSRTEEDIPSRVDITIMRHSTLRTDPASYSEVCDTFRPRLACTRRTDSGRERFIDFLVPSPVRDRFVAEPRLGRKTSLHRAPTSPRGTWRIARRRH